MSFKVREININFLKENISFLHVILNYIKCYFCFFAWFKNILHKKYVKTFSFAYNRKYGDIMFFVFCKFE